MPLVDADDPAVWAAWFAPPYARENRSAILGGDHWRLIEALGVSPGDRIAVIGAGFGWIAEDWLSAGYGPIVCTDTSSWIQAGKGLHAAIEILDADVRTPAGRLAIGQADWIVSEDVLPLLSDAEAVELAAAMRLIAPRVAHWVSVVVPSSFGPLNWKTAEDWKALLGPDLIVARGGSEAI